MLKTEHIRSEMPKTHKTTPKKRSIPVYFPTHYRILYAENNLHTIRTWQERVKKNGVEGEVRRPPALGAGGRLIR